MGGYESASSYKNDVWKSDSFGTSWTLVTNTAPWGKRYGHTSVVVGNTILVMGGYGILYLSF